MAKSKFIKSAWRRLKAHKPGKYFRELSVVIIGVAVTFYVSGLISSHKEKKDLNLQLEAIYSELEYNLEEVKALDRKHKNHQRLGELLRQALTDPEAVSPDTIHKYSRDVSTISMFNHHTAAYHMFVNSGAIKFMTNRELLLQISKCYSLLDIAKSENDLYNDFKMKEFHDIMHLDKRRVIKEFDIMDPEYNAIFNFYTSMTVGHTADAAKQQIGKILNRRTTKP